MKKAQAFFLLACFFIFTMPLYPQAEEDGNEDEIPIESDWYGELPPLYSKGDKTFNISMGLTFPTLFIQDGTIKKSNISPVGGTGSLAFNYFLDSHFFLGGEIGGQFSSTLAGNTLFIIPIGIRGGYQFVVRKIEIPLSLVMGISPHRFLNLGYAGFFIKGGVSSYYRFSPDWSFGMDVSWAWFPEWTREPKKDASGNFVHLVLSARYHF